MEEGLLRNFFAEARILVILAECRSETCDAEFKAVGRRPEEGSSGCSSSRTGMVDCPAFGGCLSQSQSGDFGRSEQRVPSGDSRVRGEHLAASGDVFACSCWDVGGMCPASRGRRPPHAAGRAPMHAAAPATVDVSRPQVALVRGREALEDVGAPHASSFLDVKWYRRV